ncbi:MAG: hypothetical protein C0504_07380 [Candidatus Solibacter sp.]|nr:hypothetical protein [Candidatus Solibacter sp.]
MGGEGFRSAATGGADELGGLGVGEGSAGDFEVFDADDGPAGEFAALNWYELLLCREGKRE